MVKPLAAKTGAAHVAMQGTHSFKAPAPAVPARTSTEESKRKEDFNIQPCTTANSTEKRKDLKPQTLAKQTGSKRLSDLFADDDWKGDEEVDSSDLMDADGKAADDSSSYEGDSHLPVVRQVLCN